MSIISNRIRTALTASLILVLGGLAASAPVQAQTINELQRGFQPGGVTCTRFFLTKVAKNAA